MSLQTGPGRSTRRLTVQGWLLLVLSLAGALVLVGAVVTVLLLIRTDRVSKELNGEIQPARVAAYQLQAALRDQETAVRGYLIAADQQFLVPYFDGQRAAAEAAAEIRDRVGDHPQLVADLDAVTAAASTWRTNYAEPAIAAVAPGRPTVTTPDAADQGKAEFDRIRGLFVTQTDNLNAVRTQIIDDLHQAQSWRNGVLIGVLAVFLCTAVLLAILIRNAVTRPLGLLAAACRRITDGDFEEKIIPRGPRDIRAIAADVEDMRQRVVDELAVSRSAHETLAQQTQVLDEQTVELRRSNAELEQFAYVASHDLQEPLRKVASFCQLLEKRYGDQLDDRGHEYIQFAVDGAKRMQVLINDLLTFSRVGRLNTTLAEVDLGVALDAALGNVATAIQESGAQIILPAEPLPVIMGDPTLLTMLWQNLIGNAVKFRAADRTPRVQIGCEPDTDGNWQLSVSDNGIGIAEEFAEKVFVIFQRLHGRDAYTGTGIGLALCKKIVEYHGGTIWIDTTYTGGTRFRFALPIVTAAAGPAVREGSPA